MIYYGVLDLNLYIKILHIKKKHNNIHILIHAEDRLSNVKVTWFIIIYKGTSMSTDAKMSNNSRIYKKKYYYK
jgi:hypothetical protein